jgi:N-acetyl-anhydromuramyl-L-alanine amidase AmpD
MLKLKITKMRNVIRQNFLRYVHLLISIAFFINNFTFPSPLRSQPVSLGACSKLKIISHLVNWGYKADGNRDNIEAIIIHSSYNALTKDSFNLEDILKEYKEMGVSPHYIIDRNGRIYRLVNDKDIAYHAGKSKLPDGKTDVNSISIGVEIINTKKDSPTANQYTSLVNLVRCLFTKYPIKYILGHSDIAPQRKTDPWNFNWKKFYSMLKE